MAIFFFFFDELMAILIYPCSIPIHFQTSKGQNLNIITKLNLEYTHFKISKFKVRIDHRKAIVVRLRSIFLTQKVRGCPDFGLELLLG